VPIDINYCLRYLIVGVGASVLNSLAVAELAVSPDPTTVYKILPQDFEYEKIPISPPPINNLKEAKLLYEMKALRTRSRVQEIISQNLNPIPLFWKCSETSENDYPEFTNRFYNILSDVEIVVLALKKKFNRPRPSFVLPALDTVVSVPWHSSYPSGHAAQSIVIAGLLSRLKPDFAARLNNLAFKVGVNREVAGLHYPSDTTAGVALGRWLLDVPSLLT
jgi:acid phosphatase (class A)